MHRFIHRHFRAASLLAAALIITGCSADRTTGPSGPQGEFVLSASVVGTTIATMVVEVTAPDITSPLAFNIPITNGVATGSIKLPPGENRTITLKAFDNLGNETHEGSKTISVRPGQNPPVSIPVVSKAGQVTINAVMGPVSISVSPATKELAVGGTVQLTVTITAPNGDILAGPPAFATLNPSIATVDNNGLVTAVSEGTVQIVATYAGVGGASSITIGSHLAVIGGSTLTLYDVASLAQVATYTLPGDALSVTGASNGQLYLGATSKMFAVDPLTGNTTTFGVGVVSDDVYGVASRGSFIYATGYGQPDLKTFNLDGSISPLLPIPLQGSGNVRSVAFGPDGSFYLTSFNPPPVQRWNPGFIPAGTFGLGAGLTSAFGVDVRSNGNVIVAGQNDAAYFVFSANGTFIRRATVNCEGQLRNVAVDFSDNVWVACFGSNAVVKFDTADQEVARITVTSPSGVAIY